MRRPALPAVITGFCNEFCKDLQMIVLYGSYATQTQTENSDVDLLIVDNSYQQGCRIQRVIDGYPIQAAVMNARELVVTLQEATKKSNPFWPGVLQQPLVLFDKAGLSQHLAPLAAEKLQQGAGMLAPAQLELMRIGIVNFMNDGTSEKYLGTTRSETVVWAAKLLTMLEDYLLACIGGWLKNNARFKKAELLARLPQARLALHQQLDIFLTDFNAERYVQGLKAQLQDLMQFDWDTQAPHHAAIL